MAALEEPVTQPTELDVLAYEWRWACIEESEARKKKWRVEEQLLKLMGEENKLETEFYKIGITRGEERRITDPGMLELLCSAKGVQGLVKWKADLDGRKFTALREALPDVYREIAQYIEVKPRKPQLKIEELQQ